MLRLMMIFMLAATPALALTTRAIVFTADDGATFHVGTTAAGVVFIAPDAAPNDLFLLTPDCMATHATLGTGSWGHEAAGWQVAFDGAAVLWFAGQTPPLDAPDCLMLR